MQALQQPLLQTVLTVFFLVLHQQAEGLEDRLPQQVQRLVVAETVVLGAEEQVMLVQVNTGLREQRHLGKEILEELVIVQLHFRFRAAAAGRVLLEEILLLVRPELLEMAALD
jgi:hypothetical protein